MLILIRIGLTTPSSTRMTMIITSIKLLPWFFFSDWSSLGPSQWSTYLLQLFSQMFSPWRKMSTNRFTHSTVSRNILVFLLFQNLIQLGYICILAESVLPRFILKKWMKVDTSLKVCLHDMCVPEKNAKGKDKEQCCPAIKLPPEYKNAEKFLKEFSEKKC